MPTDPGTIPPLPHPCPDCTNGFIRTETDVRACSTCRSRAKADVLVETARLEARHGDQAFRKSKRKRSAAAGSIDAYPWFSA